MKIPEIKETRDYSIFKRLEGNRDVKCVKKIIESIKEIGYLFSPIMVNEKMQIIDGQNRLEAAKALNLPVYYYIEKGIGIEEAISLNLGRTNWKPIDYVKSYAEQGKKPYQCIVKLMEDYPFFKLQEVVGILMNKVITSGWSVSSFTDGNFDVTKSDFEKAIKKLDALNGMQSALSNMVGNRRLYISAIAWCMDVDGVKVNRLANIINTKYPAIRPIVEINPFLEDLTKIYNRGLAKEKQVFFDIAFRMNK